MDRDGDAWQARGMSYRAMGQEPALGPDVASTLPEAILRQRGWVAIPTADVREYSRAQIVTMGAGFVVGFSIGVAVGSLLGNVLRRNAR